MKNKLIIWVLLALGALCARGQGASTCQFVYMEDDRFMYQGEQNAASGSDYAGNAFDHYSTNTERDFYVDQVIASSLDIPNYEYYSHSDSTHRIKYYTITADSLVYNKGMSEDFDETDCSGDGGIGMGMLSGGFEQIETLDNEISIEEYDLAEAIDNGSSLQLLGMVETMNTTNSTAVAEAIGEAGGLISDEVALAYMENDAGNPFAKAGALLENSPLPITVKGEIDNMEMNPALVQIIKQNQVGVNARDSIEALIAAKKQVRSLSLKNIVNYAMENDTIPELRTSVIEFLESDYQLEAKWHLYDLYRLKGEYANARNTLGVIDEMTTGMDIDYASEMHDYINLELVVLNIAAGTLSVEDAVESNKALIEKIAHTESHFGQVTAQLLLAEAGVEPYYEIIRLPEPVMDTKSAKISVQESNTITVSADIVNIYPNPSDGYINIEYALFTSPVNKFIEIYTLQGSLIERIPIKQNAGFVYYNKALSAGTYLVKVGDSYTQKVEVK